MLGWWVMGSVVLHGAAIAAVSVVRPALEPAPQRGDVMKQLPGGLFVLLTVALGIALFGRPATVSAHADYESSTPAIDEVVQAAPSTLLTPRKLLRLKRLNASKVSSRKRPSLAKSFLARRRSKL